MTMKPLAVLAIIAGVGIGACSDMNSTQQRTLSGAGAGAAGGAAIGAITGGSAVGGALLGGAAGAAGGYIYDKNKND